MIRSIDNEIDMAIDEVESSIEDAKDVILRIRETCPHEVVAELPFHSSDLGTCFYPRRICYKCRLEETTTRATEFTNSKGVGCDLQLHDSEDRIVEKIDIRDDFFKLRLSYYIGV